MELSRVIAVASACLAWPLLPGHANRLQDEGQDLTIGKVADASHGLNCPDAFSCIPASCNVENSEGDGLACRCKHGFVGTITWSGLYASGKCTPVPCHIKNSNGKPGPACRCKDGFEGNVTWSGSQVTGECRPAPCDIENSDEKPGLACRCNEGFAGEIAWSGPKPIGVCTCSDGFRGKVIWEDGAAISDCRPAPCSVRFSNHRPGLECGCRDSAIGQVRWAGAKATGPCTPAPCGVKNSNRLAGRACACDNYSEGPPITWEAGRAHGQCEDKFVEVVHLFDAKKSLMQYGGREFKCCVSSQSDVDPKIVDLSAEDFKRARRYGRGSGCGRLLGDTWHGAHRSKSCKVRLGVMADSMRISRDEVIRLVRGEDLPKTRVDEDLINPSVVAGNAEYTFFQKDIDHYDESFGPYLPFLKTQEVADSIVLFLPVSYHTNPANFEKLKTKWYYIEDSSGWQKHDVCSATDLDYYQDGPNPESAFCGYAGRKSNYDCACDDDPNCGIAPEYQDCKAWCFADVREAFGPTDRADLENPPSEAQVSFYFTWYSKTQNQPLITGYWTNPFLSYMPSQCSTSPGICDPTCQDSGGPLDAGFEKGGAFSGCKAERACGKFATCALGSAVISQSWADERPREYDGDEAACVSHGYYYRESDSLCKYDSGNLDCDTGRCFDRGHLVPSGVAGWHYGRSGQTFTMCNIGAQTSSLNECRWQWLEKVVACTGQYYSMLNFAGAMGPFKPSQRMSSVTRPAAFFKIVFFPRQSGLPGEAAWARDTAFVWILQNDEEKTYDAASYRGREGFEAIQKELGLQFPPAIQEADFPEDCSMFWTLLSQDGRMEACGFSEDAETSGSSGPYYLLQTCAGKTNLKAPMCPYFGDSASRSLRAPIDDDPSGDWIVE